METVHTFSLIEELGLVIQCHKGIVNGESLKQVKLSVLKHPSFNRHFKFLVDLRDTEIVMTNEELIEYELWLVNHPDLSKIQQFAIYTNSTSQVERAFEYIKNTGIRIDHYGIFTSLASAMGWLQIELSSKALLKLRLESMISSSAKVA